MGAVQFMGAVRVMGAVCVMAAVRVVGVVLHGKARSVAFLQHSMHTNTAKI